MKPSAAAALQSFMMMRISAIPAVLALILLFPGSAAGAASALTGRWVLNQALTTAEQPDGPTVRKGLFSRMPQTTVSVGGIPLPGSGGDGLPSVAGNPQDPKVLRAAEFSIEPQGDDLHLSYPGVGSETLKRGNDQGLISRWDRRRLTTRYETTSRKVSQEFALRKDGRLLVTVKLDPNQGATVIHKRVFDRADSLSAETP